MNKDQIVAELDRLKKAGVEIRPYKKSESKKDLAKLLDDVKPLAPSTTSDGSDAESAQQGDLSSDERNEADSAIVDPASIPVHPDACTPALDPDGWEGKTQTAKPASTARGTSPSATRNALR
jgi:hypothetical protein